MSKEKQIEEIALTLNYYCKQGCTTCYSKDYCSTYMKAEHLFNAGYRKQSDVIDEFVKRMKEAPIKLSIPLFGLSTKGEIEAYFNAILLEVRDAIDRIAEEMKGGVQE